MVSASLRAALTDAGDPVPLLLPAAVGQLLVSLDAPPRLAAHLRIVHDAAVHLTDSLAHRHPALAFDRDAVLYGAATHDIGKVLHPDELSRPGSAHELAGYTLLRGRNVPERLARFTRTHSGWTHPGIRIEDLLVSIADKVWKAKRVEELENLIVAQLATATGDDPWQAFMGLDDVLTQIADQADQRLAFQNRYPTIAEPL